MLVVCTLEQFLSYNNKNKRQLLRFNNVLKNSTGKRCSSLEEMEMKVEFKLNSN